MCDPSGPSPGREAVELHSVTPAHRQMSVHSAASPCAQVAWCGDVRSRGEHPSLLAMPPPFTRSRRRIQSSPKYRQSKQGRALIGTIELVGTYAEVAAITCGRPKAKEVPGRARASRSPPHGGLERFLARARWTERPG
jgi:hypothetical protein